MNFCVNEPLISQILPLFFNSHCFAEGQLLHPQILFFTEPADLSSQNDTFNIQFC